MKDKLLEEVKKAQVCLQRQVGRSCYDCDKRAVEAVENILKLFDKKEQDA